MLLVIRRVWLTKRGSRTSKSRLDEVEILLLEHNFLLQLVFLQLLIYLFVSGR